MENFQLQAVHEGFQKPEGPNALEAFMTTLNYEHEKVVITGGSEVLWTQYMSDCRGVATYTPSTGVRSLTHLVGGNASKVFFRTLAPILTSESRIILVAGGNDHDMGGEYFRTQSLQVFFTEMMDEQLRAAGMASPPPFANYAAYWSDAGPIKKSIGFVFKPDGRYGILNPNGAP